MSARVKKCRAFALNLSRKSRPKQALLFTMRFYEKKMFSDSGNL